MSDSTMKQVMKGLEEIARLAKSAANQDAVAQAIQKTKASLQSVADANGQMEDLKRLEMELDTWLSKLSVILQEPIGRQGMSKHALHWVAELKKD